MHLRRRLMATSVAVVVAGLLAGCGSADPEPSATASATATQPSVSASASVSPSSSATPGDSARVVLGLGDSLAAGFQPGKGDVRDTAYPARFAQLVSGRGTPLGVVNLGCSGETTASFINGGDCPYAAGSQLGEAVAQLTARQGNVAAVTLDIGGNDLLRCFSASGPDTACGTAAVATMTASLTTILTQLRTAAGPDIPIAVVLYYDPFSVLPILSTENKAAIQELWGQLNAALAAAATAQRATAVDLTGIFPLVDPAATPAANDPVCQLTFMCARGDFHLNEDGAGAVAQVIGTALPDVR